MSRENERFLLKVTGVWQIFHGLVSVLYFGLIQRGSVIAEVHLKYGNLVNPTTIVSLVYLYGLVTVIIGTVNLVVSNNYIKDSLINKSGWWLIFVVLISIFSSDLISFILTLSATILYHAKNKAINNIKY